MSIPKLVIFDCDGILVDTENLANRRLAEWFVAAGYPTTFEYCRKYFSGRSMASVQKEIEETTTVRLGADFVDRWNAGLPDLFAHGVEPIPYVRDFIEAVRAAGIPYCVATSARISKMHITLGQTGLLPLFEHAMFSSTMVSRGKPFPDLFLHAAKTMGFAPADCIVIEDSVAGTQAGIAAGMRVYSYHGDPYSDRDGLASAGGVLFDDMRELAGLVPIH
ncbi:MULTISPECIES: HAD family phosphatase [unclassified Mesorhizobium]|uniref:HAD family hydrolase n=1 Tax=unclassified Mesorhizobium TaxID=325217 RepID=UPI0003CF1FCF|nr:MULTISPECIES: HAD family phosphatase [unclassified Mesorhizobium]ESX21655.1 HAD family hydrolase [Mesorhizobium sp. LSJC255A00]ESX28512.1 HAD family hydrolase [Mesorhizobium sp. LSHC440B00]ESX37320.1 HAD family hydrolase [Mesorhizobium sp. LSHC432A00]ESX42345.1 HAD family hydrolase [Mesorhizobium sp. LSHC440A00]ESX77104.1 HAD family hydrolase [Mesorhizobium sp. LSHC414A00]